MLLLILYTTKVAIIIFFRNIKKNQDSTNFGDKSSYLNKECTPDNQRENVFCDANIILFWESYRRKWI